jgi:hypothetical protein
MKNTISQKITVAVLRGRAILPSRKPAATSTLTPEQARLNLAKFAELLTRLSDSRDDLDASQKISDEAKAKPEDLTETFLKTGEIPKPGELEDRTSGGKLLTSVIKSALDKLAADASRSIGILQEVKRAKLSEIETEIRAGIERPSWMRPEDFNLAVAGCPALIALGNLARISPPLLPLVVVADETPLLPGERYKPTSVGLGEYRTRPLTTWERKHTVRNDDAFDPRQLAGEITRWMRHIEEVEGISAEELLQTC